MKFLAFYMVLAIPLLRLLVRVRIPVKWATDSGGCGPGSEEPAAGVKT